MFFDLILLNRQHKARFGRAWIAGTRGVKYLTKNDVLEVNVSQLCNDIMSFVCSESDSPRSRFSLRLSATLINGTIKIHNQKAIYIINECVKSLTVISKPMVFKIPEVPEDKDIEMFETPPLAVSKVKTKKRRPPIEEETPKSELDRFVKRIMAEEMGKRSSEVAEEPVVLQARLEEITLRETQPQPQELVAIGDLGTFLPGEELEGFGIQPLPAPPSEEVVQAVPTVLVPSEESPEQAPVTFTVEALVHVSAVPEKEIPTEIQEVPREVTTMPPPPPPPAPEEPMEVLPSRPVLGELPISLIEKRDRGIVEARKTKKKKDADEWAKLLVSTVKPTKTVRIDSSKLDELILVDVDECPLPEFKLRTPNLTNLLNKFMVRDIREVLKERKELSEISSLRDSAEMRRKSGQVTPVEISERERTITGIAEEERRPLLPQIIEPVQSPTKIELPSITSTPVVRREIEAETTEIQRTREEIVAVAAEKPIVSPKKKRRLLKKKCAVAMDPFAEDENRTRTQIMDSSDYVVTINETDLENEITENPDPVTTMTILIVGTFLSLLIFLSVAGNILVCVAIYTDRGLRRIGNLFLASLAIADLFVASLVMTFAGVNDILGYWVFGAQFCDTWVAFDVMCSTASILNLCAISLDRYIHIKDPLRYGRWVTRRVALGTIATIWLLAALISFVPISLGLHRPPQPLVYNAGGQNYPTCALDLTPTYAVVSSCISFYVPCIVMIGIYCRLYCYAQKHVKNIRAITRPIDLPENSGGAKKSMKQKNKALHIHLHNHHSSPYHVSDHKAAITVGIIMGVFLICWVPFFCINIVAAFCKTCIPDITFKILTWLGYSNSAFNPIIYSIFNTEFREAFKRILTAHYPAWCKCGYQSVSLNTNDKFVTDYGTKTVIVNARRNGSFGEFSSEHLSTESVHQTRVNSAEKDFFGEGVSAI